MASVGLSMGMIDVRKNDLTVYDAAAKLTMVGVAPAGEGRHTWWPTNTDG